MSLSRMNGRQLLKGCLAGALLALVSPWLMLTELFASLPLVLLPAIGLAAIYCRFGKAAGVVTGMFLLFSFGWMLGTNFMWLAFLLMVNPVVLIVRLGDRPFFEQIRSALFAFGSGLIMAVVMLYFVYGGNLIAGMMNLVPEMIHSMGTETLEAALASLPLNSGLPTDAAGFAAAVDEIFGKLADSYQLYLPGKLFSGMLLTAVMSVMVVNRIRVRRGAADPRTSVSIDQWYLPSSAVSGMLLILVVSYVLTAMKIRGGGTVFYTVFEIAVWVFCIQALAAFARRLKGVMESGRLRAVVLGLIFAAALCGGSSYIAIIGLASAILGRRGVLRQRMERMQQDGEHKNKNDDPDDGNE